MNKTAVVFGATGLVGRELLSQLLVDDDYARVIAVVRRTLSVEHPKLEQVVVSDFSELSQYADCLSASVYFCCIGTTRRKTRDLNAYKEIDLGIPVRIAELAASLHVPVLIVVSSIGASPRSSNYYLQLKGNMELAVRAAFPGRLVFVRPSLLVGFRREFRPFEWLSTLLMLLINPLIPSSMADYRSIRASKLAAGMRGLAAMPETDLLYQRNELYGMASQQGMATHRKEGHNLKKTYTWLFLLFICLIAAAVAITAVQQYKRKTILGDLPEISARGELRALTLYSSVSYFIYRDVEMGYEYELCSQLANSLGLDLKMITAPTVSALLDSLDKGVGDIVAYNVPLTSALRKHYIPCGREFLIHPVLVQRNARSGLVRNVTDLLGREVVVQQGSPYYTRLLHLDEELGGDIDFRIMTEDSMTTEDLIEQVANGQIDYTIADNVLAAFNKTFYKNVHVSTVLGFPQHAHWLVRRSSPVLADSVTRWFGRNVTSVTYKAINKRYFELSKGTPSPFFTTGLIVEEGGRLSPYDSLFKQYAAEFSLDWRLLASIGYQESKFDAQVVSWAGAVGLMQIMPSTARAHGVEPSDLPDPEINIQVACRLLSYLDHYFRSTKDIEHRTKLVLAAFNCGEMHVNDAKALAKKYGKDPHDWENVLQFLLLKRLPKYYEDPVCKRGYLRGTETANFVTEVWTRYQYYLSKGV